MDKDNFVSLVTSQEWRDKLKALLSGSVTPTELEGHSESEQLLLRWFFNADPYAGVAYYVRKNRPVPVAIGRAILEDRKPKKRGRNADREGQAAQRANDIACFLATQYLEDAGWKPSPACDFVGKLMKNPSLSRQAVNDACKRVRKLL